MDPLFDWTLLDPWLVYTKDLAGLEMHKRSIGKLRILIGHMI